MCFVVSLVMRELLSGRVSLEQKRSKRAQKSERRRQTNVDRYAHCRVERDFVAQAQWA
jgi:hypothetical protein